METTITNATVRIGHVLSCFFFGHEYDELGIREDHREYVCVHCGHPLLFRLHADPYAGRGRFLKKVRYLCNLFGHKVHTVCERGGFTEYACDCGHSFLREKKNLSVARHPPVCTFLGHFIREVDRRHGIVEQVCVNCGHTFCFPERRL